MNNSIDVPGDVFGVLNSYCTLPNDILLWIFSLRNTFSKKFQWRSLEKKTVNELLKVTIAKLFLQ